LFYDILPQLLGQYRVFSNRYYTDITKNIKGQVKIDNNLGVQYQLMSKSGFIGLFLLIVTGLLAGISFLIAFGKIQTNLGRHNQLQESVREKIPPSTLPTVPKTSPTPATIKKQNPNSQTNAYPDLTQEDSSSNNQNTPTSTPTPTSSSTNPSKGKPPSNDDGGDGFVGG